MQVSDDKTKRIVIFRKLQKCKTTVNEKPTEQKMDYKNLGVEITCERDLI